MINSPEPKARKIQNRKYHPVQMVVMWDGSNIQTNHPSCINQREKRVVNETRQTKNFIFQHFLP